MEECSLTFQEDYVNAANEHYIEEALFNERDPWNLHSNSSIMDAKCMGIGGPNAWGEREKNLMDTDSTFMSSIYNPESSQCAGWASYAHAYNAEGYCKSYIEPYGGNCEEWIAAFGHWFDPDPWGIAPYPRYADFS